MEQNGMGRICKKCLLRDMNDKDAYFKNLGEYIENLDADKKVREDIYEERLGRCKECESLMQGMCRHCGCYVELRAVLKHQSCPLDKWKAAKL